MIAEPLDWTEAGPTSPRFGDVYFSAVDGLAETRAVYLEGCGLPGAWAERRRFVVAELGFGTGLNILALLDLWERTRPPGARLTIVSVEAFPISAADARRAHAAWPELAALSARMTAQWPDGRRGVHTLDFPELDARLDLHIAEVGEALAAWTGRADAWFLDGFAPAQNPQMWRQDVLDQVAARSAPGARAATFTVAGAVRRGLSAAGFTVEKRPGFGRKRERLEARLGGEARDPPVPVRVAVIGAGIAGASVVRALGALGISPTVFEAEGPAAGASGNPSGLVTPRLDAGLGPAARLHAEALARAGALYRETAAEAILAEGVLQLARKPADAERFARIAAWDGFAPGALQPLSPQEAAERTGEAPGPAGLWMGPALAVRPAAIVEAWLGCGEVRPAAVAAVMHTEGEWRLLDARGAEIGLADAVCICAGPGSAVFVDAPLRLVRGQVSWTQCPPEGPASAWGGYLAPMQTGFVFGATHDRDQTSVEVRGEDHARNLALLAGGRPALAARIGVDGLGGRAGIRAATPDHHPLAGAVPGRAGLHVLTGLGGRGLTLAPLLGEAVAAGIAGAPSPLARELAALVSPGRFSRPEGGKG